MLLLPVLVLGPFILLGWVLGGTLDGQTLAVGVVFGLPFLAIVSSITGVGLLDDGGPLLHGSALLALRVLMEIWDRWFESDNKKQDIPEKPAREPLAQRGSEPRLAQPNDSKKKQDIPEKPARETPDHRDSEPRLAHFRDAQKRKHLDFLKTLSKPLAQSDSEPRQAHPKHSKTVKAQVKISKKLARKLEKDMTCVACNRFFKGVEGVDITPETLRCPCCNQMLVI